MASTNHPGHAAMLPLASGTAVGDIPGNDTRGAIYRGGIPMVGLWAWWYRDMSPSERLLLPPGTTQEQRIRLRDTFSLQPQTHFYPLENGTINSSGHKNAIEETLDMLPSKDVIRAVGGAPDALRQVRHLGPRRRALGRGWNRSAPAMRPGCPRCTTTPGTTWAWAR